MSPITLDSLAGREGERGGSFYAMTRGLWRDRHPDSAAAARRVRVVALSRRRGPQLVVLPSVPPQERVGARKRAVSARVQVPDLGRAPWPPDPQDDQLTRRRDVSASHAASDVDRGA